MTLKDISIVSITSHKKSFTFALTSRIKWLLALLLGTIFVSFWMSLVSVYFLQTELTIAKQINEDAYITLKSMKEDNSKLQTEVEQKDLEIEDISRLKNSTNFKKSKIISNSNASSKNYYTSRINYAKQSFNERKAVLQNIPSGAPLMGYFRVSSPFGSRFHPVKERTLFHTGIDLAIATNTPVSATANGVVSYAGRNGGYGLLVVITHNFGFSTAYAHLNAFAVKKGQYVKKGDIIAYSGSTGRSTGPHVHYEVRYLNKAINPSTFMAWGVNNYDIVFNLVKGIQWNSLLNILATQAQRERQPSSMKVVS